MRRLIIAVVFASLAGVADAQTWAQRPTDEEFQQAYPPEALQGGVQGVVVLRCLIGHDGLLRACVPISEEPTGWGFSAAAAQLSRMYRVHPSRLTELEGYRGGVVELEIAFPRRE